MPLFKSTPKQREILSLICNALAKGEEITSADIHRKVSYGSTASRSAILCSIEFLEKHGLIAKEKRGRNVLLTPTSRGFALYGPRPTPEDIPA
jgi:uncharacterized membrane protein